MHRAAAFYGDPPHRKRVPSVHAFAASRQIPNTSSESHAAPRNRYTQKNIPAMTNSPPVTGSSPNLQPRERHQPISTG